jgi:formylglycine-generating enzyme required for sulfatase activity
VGSYPEGASWCGALDMMGNVWEWVDDWAGLYPGREESPASLLAPETFRLFRGGGWDTAPGHARTAFRNWFVPEKAHDSIGFRCARSP